MQNMPREAWRKNLYVIALAEFIVLLGFSLFLPFLPLYMQKLGGFSHDQAAVWVGIAQGFAGIAMFVSSPFWGLLADRWGRKPMLLRAQFGGAICVALMAIAPNVYFLVGFRIFQGLFTGTVAAASALIAAMSPKEKLPFSMGVLMAAVLVGQTLGPLLGGVLSDRFGITVTFIVTSSLLALGGLIILFMVKEEFQRPDIGPSSPIGSLTHLAFSRQIFPLLMVLAALSIGPQITGPVLPLIIDQLSGAGGAATAAGTAYALLGIVAAISSLVFSRINNRLPVRTILVFCCIGTGLLFIPPIFATSTTQLIILIGLTGLLNGGIIIASNSLVGLSVPTEKQGIAYGLSQSASALGGGIGPFIGGGIAPLIGLSNIFGVSAGVFGLVGVLAFKLIPNIKAVGQQAKYQRLQ
jgi:DHA1 family multidrug resistance protein-like MFS transporter